MKKLLSIFLATALCVTSSFNILANISSEDRLTVTSTFYETEYDPIGSLTDAESEKLIRIYNPLSNLSADELEIFLQNQDQRSRHFHITPHIHEVFIAGFGSSTTSRGIGARATPSNTTATLTYAETRTVSNNYDSTINFDGNIISATVGYNVGYSTSKLAQYEINIPPNKSGSISIADRYSTTSLRACSH